MESKTTKQFRACLEALPRDIQERAAEAYQLFAKNPQHPSLRFKKIHNLLAVYSARVSLDYRAVGILKEDQIVWFWIGTHSDYDKLLNNMK